MFHVVAVGTLSAGAKRVLNTIPRLKNKGQTLMNLNAVRVCFALLPAAAQLSASKLGLLRLAIVVA